MKLTTIPVEQATGSVLIHNIADPQGHKALAKGHRLVAGDIEKLRSLGKQEIFVGMFEAGDVPENDAAVRIAQAIAGDHLSQSAVSGGRINLMAALRGVFWVNDDALAAVNSLDGITVATIAGNQAVEPKKIVATIKTVGLAISESVLERVEQLGQEAGRLVGVRELKATRAAIILTGSQEARARVEKSLLPPIQGRIEDLRGKVAMVDYVEHDAQAIAGAITRAQASSVDCIVLAGETSIMDAADVTPMGIVQAGGIIELYGAPVEPGNLLLLAYLNELPIIGAPGCVKSRDTNVVDLILPRLLAGEQVRKRHVVALANGGLLI